MYVYMHMYMYMYVYVCMCMDMCMSAYVPVHATVLLSNRRQVFLHERLHPRPGLYAEAGLDAHELIGNGSLRHTRIPVITGNSHSAR